MLQWLSLCICEFVYLCICAMQCNAVQCFGVVGQYHLIHRRARGSISSIDAELTAAQGHHLGSASVQ